MRARVGRCRLGGSAMVRVGDEVREAGGRGEVHALWLEILGTRAHRISFVVEEVGGNVECKQVQDAVLSLPLSPSPIP